MRRKKKRKLKKQFKIILITIPILVALVALIIFAFQIKTVKVSSDLHQFTEGEVKACMDKEKIDNTLLFWLRNKIGKSKQIDMFEEYSVKMNSPFKITITAYEKKLKGYIQSDKVYYYFDGDGKILKISSEKIKSVPEVTGLEYNKLELYKNIYANNREALDTLLKYANAIEEYDFGVKQIDVSPKKEITLYIKNIQVQLGTDSNMDKKLLAFNDIYDNVVKYSGVLNMKRVSADGSYTLKKIKKSTKKASKSKAKDKK